MSITRGFAAALLLALACAPQSVDRVTVEGGVALTGGRGGSGSFDGSRSEVATGAGGAGGFFDGGSGGIDVRALDAAPDRRPPDAALPDRAPDRMPIDTALPDLPPPAPDLAPEAPPPQVVQLVVGATNMLLPGDTAIRTVLATRLPGFIIRLRDDSAAVDLNTQLIVIAGSVDSAMVANRYRDVPVPLISLEFSLFDNLGLTGTTENTDFGGADGTQINILDPLHPLAAGLSGMVSIVTDTSNLSWGNPSAEAIWVATLAGNANRAAIFAYPAGAQLRGLVAPAKRIGLFALETAASNLSGDGIQLLAAAVDWALQP